MAGQTRYSTKTGERRGSFLLVYWTYLVLCSCQRRRFFACFLCRDEIGVGVLPDVENFLIALKGGGLIKLRLSPCCAEQAQRVIGSLAGTISSLSQCHAAISNSWLEICDCLLRFFRIQRSSPLQLRNFGRHHVRCGGR